MSDATKDYVVKGKIDGITLTEDGSLPPLRMSDLMEFFVEVGRSGKCPHCPHEGIWEISMLNVPDSKDPENPKLTIYLSPTDAGESHSSVGITCPNCGHFSLINTYKIGQFHSLRKTPHG